MALTSLTIRVDETEAAYLDQVASQHEGILSKQGVMRLLLQQAQSFGWDPLDRPITLGEPSTKGEGSTSTSKAVISRKRLHTYIEDIGPFLDERLFPYKELIAAWWDIRRQIHGKKAPGTEQAWNASQNALLAILRNHGSSVLKATIEAAVAAGWRGIRESYAAVPAKGHTPRQQEQGPAQPRRGVPNPNAWVPPTAEELGLI
jgi:hypothetical protein